jgi:predicted ester cyclase
LIRQEVAQVELPTTIPALPFRMRDIDFMHIFRVVDGKITDRWGVADGATLVKQLGAKPGEEA